MIVDGKRLSESERLRMLADEEHASLEEMFYEYHSMAPPPVRPPPTSAETEIRRAGLDCDVQENESQMIRLMIRQAI